MTATADKFSDDPTIPAVGSHGTITPSDSTVLSPTTRALWVGGAGDVAVTFIDGSTGTFQGVAAGTLLPCKVTKVMAATTATKILGLY